jgi:hypothetical protein
MRDCEYERSSLKCITKLHGRMRCGILCVGVCIHFHTSSKVLKCKVYSRTHTVHIQLTNIKGGSKMSQVLLSCK